MELDPDGKNEKIFAAGLRNCSGMAIEPATGHLWCVVSERDDWHSGYPLVRSNRRNLRIMIARFNS
jgi:hypothetical protein